jgi:hypothetical protein
MPTAHHPDIEYRQTKQAQYAAEQQPADGGYGQRRHPLQTDGALQGDWNQADD